MRLRLSRYLAVSYAYLTIPCIIFFFGFLRIWWAVLFAGIFAAMGVKLIMDMRGKADDKTLEIPLPTVIATAVICLIWALVSGMGEFVWTTGDHTVRAAVLNDLVNRDWPVFYDLSAQGNPAVRGELGDGTVAFAYYFTFWMVPALAGKIFGITAARAVLVLWGGAGLFLITTGLDYLRKGTGIAALVVFFFFGGFDIIASTVIGIINDRYSTWEGWNRELYIHGNFYQTMNVFHQCIAGWLVTLLVLINRDRRNIGTIGSLIFCYSPWAAIGLLPVAFCRLLEGGRSEMRKIINAGNIIMPASILIVFGSFFTANPGATGMKGFIWEFFKKPYQLLIAYALYVVVEFLIWYIILCKDHRKDPLYWTTLITLLIFPVYKMTEANDLIMRGTMAPMFVLTVFVILKTDDVIAKVRANNNNIDRRSMGIFALLIVSAVPALLFLMTVLGATKMIITGEDTSVQPKDEIVSFGDIRNERYTEVTRRQFYVSGYEDTLFYRYLGRVSR